MTDNERLANLIFPNIDSTIEDLENKYPKRKLNEDAIVTRFAPSPTGFLHSGSLFMAMCVHKMALQTNGVFILRLEDTDTKREVEGSGKELLDQLANFNIVPTEGYMGDYEVGEYGPYKQSDRSLIYNTVIKELIKRGDAYPCFVSEEELDEIRKKQEANKENPGYYGKYAVCSFYSAQEAIDRIEKGDKYIIRFRSKGNPNNKVKVHDLIKGNLELTENDQHIVILKKDGLPTYHFAHLCDDHFMGTTHVMRGEEWLSSLPIHLELFDRMGWKRPLYAHLPVIMKLDNGKRRKLSKRLDKEAAVSYFLENGYPKIAILEYLFTLANSNFEEWRLENMNANIYDFNFTFEKFNIDGALFDIEKINNISKERLSRLTKTEFTDLALEYGNIYNKELVDLINRDRSYFESIVNIEREKENPRKDYTKFSDIVPFISFFYDDYYDSIIKDTELEFNPNFSKDLIKKVLDTHLDNLDLEKEEQVWFNNLKEAMKPLGFAENKKELRDNPDKFIGTIGDASEIIRISLSTRKSSPNLYYVEKILGKAKIKERFNKVANL